MPIPQAVGRFNRRFVNPVARLIADWVPPLAVVEHRGRVSGRTYRTPVAAFRTRDGIAIGLVYGAETDWVRNVTAAGRGRIARAGQRRWYGSPRIVRGDEGMRTVPAVVRPPLRLMGVEEFLLLESAS